MASLARGTSIGKMLTFGRERRGEIGHSHAGFDDDRHVARRVVDDAIEAGEIKLQCPAA